MIRAVANLIYLVHETYHDSSDGSHAPLSALASGRGGSGHSLKATTNGFTQHREERFPRGLDEREGRLCLQGGKDEQKEGDGESEHKRPRFGDGGDDGLLLHYPLAGRTMSNCGCQPQLFISD